MKKEGRLPLPFPIFFFSVMLWSMYWPGVFFTTFSSKETVRKIWIASNVLSEKIKIGETHQLEVYCFEDEKLTENCKPIWKSSNPEIISVSQSGQMKLLDYGLVIICASWSENDQNTVDCMTAEISEPEEEPQPVSRPRRHSSQVIAHNQEGGPYPASFRYTCT